LQDLRGICKLTDVTKSKNGTDLHLNKNTTVRMSTVVIESSVLRVHVNLSFQELCTRILYHIFIMVR
jgi:hypothetical protein